MKQSKIVVGPLVIDRLRRLVQVGGRSIHLTPKEFALLVALSTQPGKLYRREELLRRVWGEGVFVDVRTVDVHMSKLRHKLRKNKDEPILAETVWGIGYRLRDSST